MVQKKSVIPYFTIITCTRNSAKFINNCLVSVLSQSFTDFEHIIVDGNSTDDTKKIVSKYGVKIISTPPKGIANAMNIGLSKSNGKYIYFLNSDDSLHDSNVLQSVHDYLTKHSDLEWVFGNIHETDGEKTIGYPPRLKIFQGKHPNILKFYNFIPHQGTFMKKSVFEKFGPFDEDLKSMMDPEYWLRIAPHTSWDYMPIVVANYLIRSDSQSESLLNANQNTSEYESVQLKYLNYFELLISKLINKLLR